MDEQDIKIEKVSLNDADSKSKTPDNGPTPSSDDTDKLDAAATSPTDATPTADCDARTSALDEKIRDLNDKYLRMAAELENTRRRAAIDIESAARNRAMNIARQFLPVMDAADAALKHTPDDAGIKSMAMALETAFAQIGIVRMASVGTVLNPQYHNAVQAVDAPQSDTQTPHNTIIEELQSGYMFGDSVLRNAMVIVAK